MSSVCQHCGADYGDLLRNEQWRGFACKSCGAEACQRCVTSEDQGNQIAFIRCPGCNGDDLDVFDLRDRHLVFTSIEELSSFENGIALPFVAWSVYPRRTEGLIRSSLAKLSDFKPSFALLDEENQNVRAKLAEWFPGRFDADVPLGSGALIWIVAGVPVQCAIGQYLTEYEILKASRILWAASEQ